MKGQAYYRRKAMECRALAQSARTLPGAPDAQLITSLEELATAFEEEAAAAERRAAGEAEAAAAG